MAMVPLVKSFNWIRLKKKLTGLRRLVPAFLSAAFVIASLFAAETVIVNKSFHKREIKVRVGGFIRVELEQLGAAGYVWAIQNLDKDHFEVVKEETKAEPQKDDFTGAPVIKSWLIKAKKAGRSELRLVHYRPWEDEKSASDNFYLRVRIVP